MVALSITFEYDDAKSRTNKDKHGIDFEEAKALWKDDRRIEAPVDSSTEPRSLVVGTIGDKFWTAVITWRGELIRIISVRRSRKYEVTWYEKENENDYS